MPIDDIYLDSSSFNFLPTKSTILKATESKMNICITGEVGSGKSIIAKYIIKRLKVDKALFIRSGTIDNIDHGEKRNVLFVIDGVCELGLQDQRKVYQILAELKLEHGNTNRVITISTRTMSEIKNSNELFEPLYYMLMGLEVHVPPLRERRDDIGRFIQHYKDIYNIENKSSKNIDEALCDYMKSLNWPLNILQLESCINSLLATSIGDTITMDDYENLLHDTQVKNLNPSYYDIIRDFPRAIDLASTMENIEKRFVERALLSSGTQIEAAALLKISKSLLQYKMKKYSLSTAN